MTINAYEIIGGFKRELALCRNIGLTIAELEEILPARPHRNPELGALANLHVALETLRREISTTRDLS